MLLSAERSLKVPVVQADWTSSKKDLGIARYFDKWAIRRLQCEISLAVKHKEFKLSVANQTLAHHQLWTNTLISPTSAVMTHKQTFFYTSDKVKKIWISGICGSASSNYYSKHKTPECHQNSRQPNTTPTLTSPSHTATFHYLLQIDSTFQLHL